MVGGAIGLTALIGWSLRIPHLYRPFDWAVPMAFKTSYMFCLAALIAIVACLSELGRHRRYPLATSGGVVLCSMAAEAAGPYLAPFVAPATARDVPPALATISLMTLIGISGIMLDIRFFGKLAGFACLILGTFGLLGYLLHVPVLYTEIPNLTVGMAPNTCLAFVLVGAGMLIYPRPPSEKVIIE